MGRKTCSACKEDKHQMQFSKGQWKCKQSSRRCKQCVELKVPSDHGSDEHGPLTSGGMAPIEEAVRNDALQKTRARLEAKVTSWIDRGTQMAANPAMPQGASKRELENLKKLQRQLHNGPPADWNPASCGVWYPGCPDHGAKFCSRATIP